MKPRQWRVSAGEMPEKNEPRTAAFITGYHQSTQPADGKWTTAPWRTPWVCWRSPAPAAHDLILVEVGGKHPWQMPICGQHEEAEVQGDRIKGPKSELTNRPCGSRAPHLITLLCSLSQVLGKIVCVCMCPG